MEEKTLKSFLKPMERGQITIPIKIRDKLGISPETWLSVELIGEEKILIEPLEKIEPMESFSDFLEKFKKDKKSYWTKEDYRALEKLGGKSLKRLEQLTL